MHSSSIRFESFQRKTFPNVILLMNKIKWFYSFFLPGIVLTTCWLFLYRVVILNVNRSYCCAAQKKCIFRRCRCWTRCNIACMCDEYKVKDPSDRYEHAYRDLCRSIMALGKWSFVSIPFQTHGILYTSFLSIVEFS